MKKGFVEIFKESIAVAKKSILGILGVYGISILVFLILGVISALLFGRDLLMMLTVISTDPTALNSMLPSLGKFAVLLLLFFILSYISGFWTIIVVKNNILLGKSFLKAAFFETCRKIWKVIVLSILLVLFFSLITIVPVLILGKWSFIIIAPLMVFIMPLVWTISFAMMCEEGGFVEIFTNALNLGYSNWGHIFVISLLFFVATFFFMILVGVVQIGIIKILGLAIIGQLVGAVCQFMVQIVVTCFLTDLYLNVSGKTTPVIQQMPQEQITQNN